MANLAAAGIISRAGHQVDNGVAATVGGDAFDNDGATLFAVKNGAGAPITVTFAFSATLDGVAVAAGKQVSVPAGATVVAGPFPKGIYNDANGRVQVTYSAVTTVTVKTVKVSN